MSEKFCCNEFKKLDVTKLDISSNFLEIASDKGSMTAILENMFNNIDIKIINQKKIIEDDNNFYVYREIIIHDGHCDLMHATSYIQSNFFELINLNPISFLENEFLGKLIFDQKTNQLNYGLNRSEFEYGIIENKFTRCSDFYIDNLKIIKLYETFLPNFFINLN